MKRTYQDPKQLQAMHDIIKLTQNPFVTVNDEGSDDEHIFKYSVGIKRQEKQERKNMSTAINDEVSKRQCTSMANTEPQRMTPSYGCTPPISFCGSFSEIGPADSCSMMGQKQNMAVNKEQIPQEKVVTPQKDVEDKESSDENASLTESEEVSPRQRLRKRAVVSTPQNCEVIEISDSDNEEQQQQEEQEEDDGVLNMDDWGPVNDNDLIGLDEEEKEDYRDLSNIILGGKIDYVNDKAICSFPSGAMTSFQIDTCSKLLQQFEECTRNSAVAIAAIKVILPQIKDQIQKQQQWIDSFTRKSSLTINKYLTEEHVDLFQNHQELQRVMQSNITSKWLYDCSMDGLNALAQFGGFQHENTLYKIMETMILHYPSSVTGTRVKMVKSTIPLVLEEFRKTQEGQTNLSQWEGNNFSVLFELLEMNDIMNYDMVFFPFVGHDHFSLLVVDDIQLQRTKNVKSPRFRYFDSACFPLGNLTHPRAHMAQERFKGKRLPQFDQYWIAIKYCFRKAFNLTSVSGTYMDSGIQKTDTCGIYMLANTYMALTKTGDIAVADEDAGTGHGIKEFNNFFLHVLALQNAKENDHRAMCEFIYKPCLKLKK